MTGSLVALRAYSRRSPGLQVLVVATYANHLVFLCKGQFLSLADRVSGLETVFDKELPRRITYDILSRELLWHGGVPLLGHCTFDRPSHVSSPQASQNLPCLCCRM